MSVVGTLRKCRATSTMSVDSGRADLAIGRLMNLTCPFESSERKQKDRPKAVSP